jgi:hypothetical protein
MAVPASTSFTTFTELVSTTYRNHKGEFVDNVSNHNALFRRITEKGGVEKEDGGLSITRNIDFEDNQTYQRYSGYDELNITNSEVLSSVEFAWRQIAIHVTASGEEIRKNSGESRIVNLVKSRLQNAKRSMANGMSADFYSAGSLTNQINGLQALISDAGTGTVGGINSTTFTFWKNIVQSAAAPLQGGGAITPSATTIESLMLPLWLRLTRGADHPDLIIASEDYFTFYEQSQTSLKRYAPNDDGQGGMVKLRYKQAEVWHDTAASGIPSAHMYFINTDFFKFVAHQDAWMEMLDEKNSVNQEAVVMPIITMGNLIVTNRSLQGLVKA